MLALQGLAEFQRGFGEPASLEMTFAACRGGVAWATAAIAKRDGMVEEPNLVAILGKWQAADLSDLENGFARVRIQPGFDAWGSALQDDGASRPGDEGAKLWIAGHETLVDGTRVGGGGQLDAHGQRIHRDSDARNRDGQWHAFDDGHRRHTLGLGIFRRSAECEENGGDVEHIAVTLCSQRAGRHIWRLPILARQKIPSLGGASTRFGRSRR